MSIKTVNKEGAHEKESGSSWAGIFPPAIFPASRKRLGQYGFGRHSERRRPLRVVDPRRSAGPEKTAPRTPSEVYHLALNGKRTKTHRFVGPQAQAHILERPHHA